MDRSTGFSPSFGVRISLAAVAIVAGILACSDNTAPNARPELDPNTIHVVNTPESVKLAYYESQLQNQATSNVMAGAFATPSLTAATPVNASSVMAAVVAAPAYTKLVLRDTVPETDPANLANLVPNLSDDGQVQDMPIGFDFTFYGNTYNKLNLFLNGFVTFGPFYAGPKADSGFWKGGGIPSAGNPEIPNNMIALAWTDWNAAKTPGTVSYELRGTAPNRRFMIQFKNVAEVFGSGKLTGQIVLSEGSNEITLVTASMNITYIGHRVTQGLENADGTDAIYDSTLTPAGLVTPRNRGFYSLSKDVLRFYPVVPNQPPVVVPPDNISVNTDPGVCTAVVNPGVAVAKDDAPGSTVVGARSDAAATLDAPYASGATTIIWTATDAGQLTASASQTVTVSDKQAPVVVAHANISVRADRSASTATVPIEDATATDNCGDVKVSGVRSDGVPMSAGFPVGMTTITWSSTDAAGNTGSATQTVTVIGNLPPTISAPTNLAINTDLRACSAQRSPGTPVVSDDTEGYTVVGARSDHVSDLNAAYPKGVTTIVWTVTDADGLSVSESQTITVSDKEKPSIFAPASISTVNDPGLAAAAVAIGSPTVTDNCDGVEFSPVRSDGAGADARYPVGVTTVTWTARDASGNSSSAAQTITVRDNESPALNVPPDLVVNATSPSGAVVFFNVTASDNVGAGSVSCTPTSGSSFAIGPKSVTCSVSDAAGNSTSKSFNVLVLGADSQLRSLLQYVTDLGLPNGTANPLINQLRAVGDGTDAQACTKMNDFMSLLAKKGVGITDAEYSYMVGEATRIMGDMGCPEFRALKPRVVPRTISRLQAVGSPATSGVVRR